MNSKDMSPRLFLDDEFEETKIVPDKVVCLGMEFPSEDARREYFRAELRKKLPELKQIEGFPIGEDDDIINLSDPPYYTACPNPWLNDFIEEWEKEKVELEKEGKRKANFEVKTPYTADVSEGKNNPIYKGTTSCNNALYITLHATWRYCIRWFLWHWNDQCCSTVMWFRE